jgi:leader peptidase (prepilin peptidase)/N-methyltransferase
MKLSQLFTVYDNLTGAPLWFLLLAVASLGAIIGSFLNVVIHRLPREESIVFPNSRCPACAAAIKPYDNIPIISYLALGGRCRVCRAPISIRYPAVEALTAILYGLIFAHDGVGLALLFDLIFVTALVALIFIDAEHMILPDAITLPGIVFALIARLLVPNLDGVGWLAQGALAGWPSWALSLVGAALGALAGGGSLWLVGWLWQRFRGIEAMGLGDVKMMLMVGAYLGWRLTLVTIFLGAMAGAVTGIGKMVWQGQRDMQMRLPFGIFLGAGAIISLLLGASIIAWYLGQFS